MLALQNDDCVKEISSDVLSCRADGEALSREPLTLPLSRRGVSSLLYEEMEGQEGKSTGAIAETCEFLRQRESVSIPGSSVRVCHGSRMDKYGLGTAFGGAATSAANTVTLTLHTTPKRFVVRILRKVSETLWKVKPPSRKECNHLVDARTGMAEEIPKHFC